MDICVFRDEMDMCGCVQFGHPLRNGHYYVIEQNLDKKHGALAFLITPNLVIAERIALDSEMDTLSFIERIMTDDGYVLDLDAEIPKTEEDLKWQLSPRIRYIIPQ